MRYFIVNILIILMSCSVSNKISLDENIVKNRTGYKKKSNENYILNYKIERLPNSSIKNYSFYITDKNNVLVRKEETITAENISWKNNNTLSIIPYVGMIQKEVEISEEKIQNEILIKIQ